MLPKYIFERGRERERGKQSEREGGEGGSERRGVREGGREGCGREGGRGVRGRSDGRVRGGAVTG